MGHVDFHTRAHNDHVWTTVVPDVIAGREGPPARYRVLAPYAYEALVEGTGLPRESGWILFRWLCLFASFGALHFYFRTWFSEALSIGGTLLVAALLPLTFTNSWPQPDHFTDLALFSLGCALIARAEMMPFAVVLVLSALNRETSAFLVLLFALSRPFDRRHLAWTAAFGALWAAIYVGLRLWLGFVPYDPWQLARNIEFLRPLPPNYDPYYRVYGWFWIVLLVPLAWATAVAWRALPRFLRMSAGVVAPLFVLTCVLFSSTIETRIFTPLLPLMGPAVLFAPRREARDEHSR